MRVELGVKRTDYPKLLCGRQYKTGAEIGVAQGDHALHILQNWPGFLYLIDCWQPQNPSYYKGAAANWTQQDHDRHYQHCRQIMQPYVDRTGIIKGFSSEVARCFEDHSLDWVYIDANHSYNPFTTDLIAWYPKVKKGGMISGHDYTVDAPPREGNVFGVKPAVNDFAQHITEVLYVSNDEWPEWYWFKK